VAAGVARVVIGAPDPNPRVDGGGIAVLREAGIEVTEGVLTRECAALNVGFNQRMTSGRPWLRVKLAISLDGRTALADGTSQWISAAASRADVQRWRARSSAILTGIGTVLGDDPSLNVRDPALESVLQPQRIIVDSALRTPVDARLLGLPGQVRIFFVDASADTRTALESAGAVVEKLPGVDGRVDLHVLLRRLGELEINELTVEAGPALCGALLSQHLVDELLVYQAAHVLGSDGRGMFNIPALTQMQDRPAFDLVDTRRTGDDLRLIYRRKD
jgi:diaminohydroxyphosphoribosylaminopyrimidine deaminase/5-amino-6-(5-phosphoribosylamino)uracil reductase